MKQEQSKKLYDEANRYIPGGVNSPVRSFKAVDAVPIFVKEARGSRVFDYDGNAFVDYVCSWGPLMFGHAPDFLTDGIEEIVKKGTSYGLPTAIEIDVAKLIVEAHEAVDQVRMVNSGTEATMSALRLARGYTNRTKILKFEGCYHGHSDALLVKSGSGTLTFGVPTSPGVPEEVVRDTLTLPFNDVARLTALFAEMGDEIAAVIVEPVAGNMGVISATQGFLETMRALCDAHGSVLIFDEVITGFRLCYNSAAGYFGVKPDLVCFGKIIGAGLPVGAYGGRSDIMALVSPIGPVYQAGTLSGNPLAMHMGKKNLEKLRDNPEVYTTLAQRAGRFADGLRKILAELSLDYTVNHVGSLVTLFFTSGPVSNYDDVKNCDTTAFNCYFKSLLEQGILIPPTQYEAMFFSLAHSDADIDATLNACKNALIEVKKWVK